ncbi:hypothetical protein ABZX77_24080 [Streptomyces sp. NPDC004237]|uniref:hypothetical protein n=1 Tax=Streptomyces sp. NPDC004237 TaxID=3154455 RepID=UPI0033AA9DDA
MAERTGTNDDALEIRQLTENSVLWRDTGRWDRFATGWHPTDGYTNATWFHGSATDFIEAGRQGFERGVSDWIQLGPQERRTT